MDWIKQQLVLALTNKKPLSKKALISFVAIVAAVVFVLNAAANTGASNQIQPRPPLESTAPIIPPKIFVHLVGEVAKPGIYELDSGARVMDAIFAASGFTKNAEQSSINLARELTDGEQVVVLKIGEFSPMSTQSSATATISLNRASAAELESLPGVGPALAGRIVDWRDANGGFKKKEDLLNISGIGQKLFAGIKNQVVL